MATKDPDQEQPTPAKPKTPAVDELNDWQLRALARELGIANNDTLPEGQLREQVRQRQQT